MSTTKPALAEDLGIDIEQERERLVSVGDSPNDQPMFAHFPNAIGVAIVREMAEAVGTIRPFNFSRMARA